LVLLHLLAPLLARHLAVVIHVQRVEELAQLHKTLPRGCLFREPNAGVDRRHRLLAQIVLVARASILVLALGAAGVRRRRKLPRGGVVLRDGGRQPCRSDELLPRQRSITILVDAFESAADLLQRITAEVFGQEGLVLLHLLAPLLARHLAVVILVQRVEELPQLLQAFGHINTWLRLNNCRCSWLRMHRCAIAFALGRLGWLFPQIHCCRGEIRGEVADASLQVLCRNDLGRVARLRKPRINAVGQPACGVLRASGALLRCGKIKPGQEVSCTDGKRRIGEEGNLHIHLRDCRCTRALDNAQRIILA